MNCNEDYGCGEEAKSLFSVLVRNDDDELITVKVCRDCAASGDWADEE